MKKRKKWLFQEVKNLFEQNKCVLLSTNYINAKSHLQYKCSCGNIAQIAFDKFKTGQRCKECMKAKLSEKYRLNKQDVADAFHKRGCKLLGEYIQKHKPVLFQCVCGNISHISFSNFQLGRLCKKCGMKLRSGIHHYKWNILLSDEERLYNTERISLLREWRIFVFQRDNYTCQLCHRRGVKLNAHHLNSYDIHPNERKNINNGIVLCEKCHYTFHQKYGRGHNTKKQYEEFKTQYSEHIVEEPLSIA